MKSEQIFTLLSFAVIVVLALLPVSLAAADGTSASTSRLEPVSTRSGKLTITIDPRVELLTVLQYLSGSDMVRVDYAGYAKAVDDWFSPFKEHQVFTRLRNMEANGFSYDLPVGHFLRFDSVPLLKQDRNYEPYAASMNKKRLKYVAKAGELKDFYSDVNDFVALSDFGSFFHSQRSFYEAKIAHVDSLLTGQPDMVAHLIDWYGYEHHAYTLVLSPLVGFNGYGVALVNKRGETDVHCVTAFEQGKSAEDDRVGLAYMIFHEFSHSYVNTLVDKHFSKLKKAEKLFQPIAKKMESQAYGSWWITVVEHYVRASELRLLQSYFRESLRQFSVFSQQNRGFIYIDQIHAALQEYEQARRENGITYREYFPTLIKGFIQLKDMPESYFQARLGFKGPLNSVAMGGNVLVIYPDPARVAGVSDYIMPTVDFLVERLQAKAITDTEALQTTLSENNLYVYGTLEDNLWLAQHAGALPFVVAQDRIVADIKYPGDSLRIVCCLPNPYNPELGMAIYTAQTIPDMKSSNSFFHGPEDWVVTDSKLNVLGRGFFEKNTETWQFMKDQPNN